MTRILIVEDEPLMRLGLKKNLEFEGYQVDCAEDGQSAVDKILENGYHLVLLDVMIPKITGLDVCKKIREKGDDTPVIMLTAKGEEIDKVLGLELGADDYITKPFSLRELLARIKAILRRQVNSDFKGNEFINIGNLKINLHSYDAYSDGKPVSMTHREFEIIKYLWQHQNEPVSRDDLLDNIWGVGEIITTRTIDNFILKLRQKIERDPAHPRYIITVHKIGYKLVL